MVIIANNSLFNDFGCYLSKLTCRNIKYRDFPEIYIFDEAISIWPTLTRIMEYLLYQ